MPGARAAAVAVALGGVWATIQAVYTVTVLEHDDDLRDCAAGHPETAFAVITALACVAAIAAIALLLSRRARAAILAVGGEATLAVTWFAAGGWSAAGCAIA